METVNKLAIMEHTPGPWTAHYTMIFDAENHLVAEVRGWGHLFNKLGEAGAIEAQESIARRIAAIPELLGALEAVETFKSHVLTPTDDPDRKGAALYAEWENLLSKACAALAKARGEQ